MTAPKKKHRRTEKEEAAPNVDFDFDSLLSDESEDEQLGAEIATAHTEPFTRTETEREQVLYEHAEELAAHLRLDKGMRADAIVSGNFIFGDFIEAYLKTHNGHCREMIITTLSLSQDNVDSLFNLLADGWVDDLTMIVSAYFYGNERGVLIPYIYEKLGKEQKHAKFRLAVAGLHTKTCQFITDGGRHMIIHGSANLRSSGNIEQFTIEENESLYQFYKTHFTRIADHYERHKQQLRAGKLWEEMQINRF